MQSADHGVPISLVSLRGVCYGSEPAVITTAPPRRHTILVIDDAANFRDVWRRQWVGFGLDVVEATDGRDRLGQLERAQPDIGRCDLTMPILGALSSRGECEGPSAPARRADRRDGL
jgi:CheY-like chemotaxis protein